MMKLYQTAIVAIASLILAMPAFSQEKFASRIHDGLKKTFQADFPPKENHKSQSKEKLADDPRVLHGKTANGITYYIVKNMAKKGYADFYLVQKGGMAVEDTSEAGITRFLQDMTSEGCSAAERCGFFEIDRDGDIVTPLMRSANGPCAYSFEEDGKTFCAVERAYCKGLSQFRKPISCLLLPDGRRT